MTITPETSSVRFPGHRATSAVAACLLAAAALALPAVAVTAAPACRAELVVDGYSLAALHEHNARRQLPTASMIKMLTGLVAADAVERGEVDWDTVYTVSREASLIGGSQVYLKQGETFTLGELAEATMIKSANDAAFAIAEVVAGSEEAFLDRMRAKADELGLVGYQIVSPSGLPSKLGAVGDDRMNAHDLARIGQEVLTHPRLAELARTDLAWFRDGTFQLFSFNYLLRWYPPAMGIKTGYHRRADFNITAAAERDGARVIAVLMGCQRKAQLFARAEELLDEGFDHYRTVPVIARGETLALGVRIGAGQRPTVPVIAARAIHLTAPRGAVVPVEVRVYGTAAAAPVRRGDPVGRIVVHQEGRPIGEAPALAAVSVAEVPWWRRLWQRFAVAVSLR